MEKRALGTLFVPQIAVGCMGLAGLSADDAAEFISTAVEKGSNFFDHADIYGAGSCEERFAEAFKKTGLKRDDIFIQSKCGIVSGKMYDFSKEHIISSVEGSLKRLKTDFLDCLLLHRPDALCEPEEVAQAIDSLYRDGKILNFGVSNHNPYQIELLKKFVGMPIVINQLQLSITNATMISSGMTVNTLDDNATDRDGHILDYCRLNNITIQPWSPFRYGFFEGIYIDNDEKFPELNKKLREIAEKYSVTSSAVVFAWILRHPAHMMPITGTTKINRLKECISGTEISLSRDEWYEIYRSAGYPLP